MKPVQEDDVLMYYLTGVLARTKRVVRDLKERGDSDASVVADVSSALQSVLTTLLVTAAADPAAITAMIQLTCSGIQSASLAAFANKDRLQAAGFGGDFGLYVTLGDLERLREM